MSPFWRPSVPILAEENRKDQSNCMYCNRNSIHSDETGTFVWIADQSKKVAKKRPVTVGDTAANGLTEIKSGLDVSSRIISDSTTGLRDGTRIRVSQEDSTLGTGTEVQRKSVPQSVMRTSEQGES